MLKENVKKMKNKRVIKLVAIVMIFVCVLSICCYSKVNNKYPKLIKEWSKNDYSFSFDADSFEILSFSQESADAVLAVTETQQAEYEYSYLYQLDEVFARLYFDSAVKEHQYSALDAAGELNADYLTETVIKNNETYLKDEPFGYKNTEKTYISKLCDFIVFYINLLADKYPDIDWDRVYCNLGNLKILYNTGMVSYAQVSPDMVLSINKSSTKIALNTQGEDAFSRVLIHEIIHILQLGCQCEEIDNCSRRAGISVFWDDFPLNTTDWTWLAEGSAERIMCGITGKDAVAYQYEADYICSFTMSVILSDNVNADTMETLCFYNDADLLFDVFDCKDQSQQTEILNLMITTNILQMQPTEFYEVYKEATSIDLNEDDEALNNFRYSLKPSICITLAKEFYENIVIFLQEKDVTLNDLFFMLNLFESHLNQHLKYTDATKAEINEPFISSYKAMREALFSALERDNPQMNFSELYESYTILTETDKLNASLEMLSDDKINFLTERAQWLSESNGLGIKV